MSTNPYQEELANIPNTNVSYPNQKGTYYDMKELQERHKEILRMLSLGVGKGDIARKLGVTVAMVRYVTRSTLGQAYLATITQGRDFSAMTIHEQFEEMAPDALDVIRDTIAGSIAVDFKNEKGEIEAVDIPVPLKLRLDASRDVLSRAGYVAPTKVEGHIQHTHDTLRIIETAKEKIAQERIVTADYKTVDKDE